jgi:hypothetical protein
MPRIACALLLALTRPGAALAGPEVARDRRELRDDLRDARKAEWLLHEYDRAWHARDRRGLAQVEARVLAALDAELREARHETGHAAGEVYVSREEVRADRHEGMWDAEHQDPPGTRSDVRALREDRRDLMREVEYRDRIRSIRAEFRTLRGSRLRSALHRKHDLLQELVRLSHYEIRADHAELREDRQGH